MKAGFISGSMFCIDPKGNFRLRQHDYKSLIQWTELFDEVNFYFTEVPFDSSKESWIAFNDSRCKFIAICNHDDTLANKIKKIRIVAMNNSDCDLYYYRLPSYEPMIFHFYAGHKIPYFIELHGDHETAILTGTQPWFIKYPLARFVCRYTKKMGKNCAFAYSIGEALVKKYVPIQIPQYVTTNHLTSISEYPQECPYRELSNPVNLLFVGAIQHRKGLSNLFAVLDRMHKSGYSFIMNIVGSGEQQSELELYADAHGFGENVKFWGQITHGIDLYTRYKNADIFILPSVSAEGVPRVTHEAMIFGCPVIATDIGSIAWQLSGGAGIVLKPNDNEALYDSIIRLINNPELRKKYIYTAYEKSKLFSWEKQKEGNNDFARSQFVKLGLR